MAAQAFEVEIRACIWLSLAVIALARAFVFVGLPVDTERVGRLATRLILIRVGCRRWRFARPVDDDRDELNFDDLDGLGW